MPQITLPQRSNHEHAEQLEVDRSFIIIGANGAGKTRFTRALADSLGSRAYRVSALDGLYPHPDSERDGVLSIEKLLGRLMHDEMLNLIAYKLSSAAGENPVMKSTRLDAVINLWQEVFPGNRVLIDSGKILFSRDADMDDAYSALRLSDGERAVLYYAGSVLYAPHNAVIFVDSPEIFLHPTLTTSLWNRIELLRSDCTFCYTTHDTEFASSRGGAPVVWVRDFSPADNTWSYVVLPPDSGLSPELYMTLVGARKPVLFIEGDREHSIDARLYPLIFPDFTVQPLGSCNKVIEATRTFSDLGSFHKMDSWGIVDRDRRDEKEVDYLRRRKIMVPLVAEIENMLLLEDVVRAVAEARHKDPDRIFAKVCKTVIALFRGDLHQQAMLHTRHRVKRTMEYRTDAKCPDIDTFETHLSELFNEVNPRKTYNEYCHTFVDYAARGDYAAILQVFNRKSMVGESNVAQLCAYHNREAYIDGIISILRTKSPQADMIRGAVRRCLNCPDHAPFI